MDFALQNDKSMEMGVSRLALKQYVYLWEKKCAKNRQFIAAADKHRTEICKVMHTIIAHHTYTHQFSHQHTRELATISR